MSILLQMKIFSLLYFNFFFFHIEDYFDSFLYNTKKTKKSDRSELNSFYFSHAFRCLYVNSVTERVVPYNKQKFIISNKERHTMQIIGSSAKSKIKTNINQTAALVLAHTIRYGFSKHLIIRTRKNLNFLLFTSKIFVISLLIDIYFDSDIRNCRVLSNVCFIRNQSQLFVCVLVNF